jgi:hypothetical protein
VDEKRSAANKGGNCVASTEQVSEPPIFSSFQGLRYAAKKQGLSMIQTLVFKDYSVLQKAR